MLADADLPLLLTTEALADELPTQWTLPLLLDTDCDVIALNPDEALPETVVAAEQLSCVNGSPTSFSLFAILILFLSVFYGPKANVSFTPMVYPFLREFQDTSGHGVTLRDTKDQRLY